MIFVLFVMCFMFGFVELLVFLVNLWIVVCWFLMVECGIVLVLFNFV